MKDRLRQQDITDYALNELEPRERLYVESLMLGSDDLREDAAAMVETARLLEFGFANESSAEELLELGTERRDWVLAHSKVGSMWRTMGKVAVGAVSLAACVVFSVAAPLVWGLAVRPGVMVSGVDGTRSVGEGISSAVIVGGMTDTEFFSFQASPSDDSASGLSLPNVTIGFMEMPLPAINVDLN